MLIGYICFSIFIGILGSIAFSSHGSNLFWKLLFIAYTLFSVILLLGQLQPLINSGAMRLV